MWHHAFVPAGVLLFACASAWAQESPGRRCFEPEQYIAGTTAFAWAERFAPILRFGDGERYFPTLPFFAAFDAISNDGTRPDTDLLDTEEISPGGVTVNWNQVNRWYRGIEFSEPSPGMAVEAVHVPDTTTVNRAAADSGRARGRSQDTTRAGMTTSLRRRQLKSSAVSYRVCQLGESETQLVWRYLRSDEQAWRRFQKLDLSSKELRKRSTFIVVEYFLYYLSDAGLKGHENDMEGVFVLQMLDHADTAQRVWQGKPVVVIGAGHSDLTPNSILVLMPDDLSTLSWVREFPDRTPPPHREPPEPANDLSDRYLNILVELGGHSSAPDIDPYGSFSPGVDVNWHLDDVWGIRDVQAISGTGFGGPWRSEMHFPRTASAPVAVPRSVDCRSFGKSPCSNYTLMSTSDLRHLVEGAADTSITDSMFAAFVNDTLAKARAGGEPVGSTRKYRFAGVGFPIGTDMTEVRAARQAMARWLDGFGREGKRFAQRTYLPWLSGKATTHLSDNLKLDLFRPAAKGISTLGDVLRLVTYGARYETDDRLEPYVGFVVPAFASDFAPMRLPGFIEIQAGLLRRLDDATLPHVLALSAIWEHHYVGNVPVSYYQRISWIPHRERALGDSTAANGSFATGVSMLLYTKKHKTPTDPINGVRLRTGVRIDLGHWSDALRHAGWEVSLSFRQ